MVRRLVHVGLSAVVAWIAAEVIVAGYLYYGSGVNPFTSAPPFHTRPAGRHVTFLPAKESFPGIVGVSRYTTNSQGLRGPEFPPRDAAYRILTIGGSTTECIYLDDTETWQHLLMQRLNQQGHRQPVWIGSAGISGFPTLNHLRFVTESPLMQQVDALIFLIGANDFNQFLRGNLRDNVFHRTEETKIQPIWRYLTNRWNGERPVAAPRGVVRSRGFGRQEHRTTPRATSQRENSRQRAGS